LPNRMFQIIHRGVRNTAKANPTRYGSYPSPGPSQSQSTHPCFRSVTCHITRNHKRKGFKSPLEDRTGGDRNLSVTTLAAAETSTRRARLQVATPRTLRTHLATESEKDRPRTPRPWRTSLQTQRQLPHIPTYNILYSPFYESEAHSPV